MVRGPVGGPHSEVMTDTEHLVVLPKARPVPAYEGPAARPVPQRARRITLTDRLVAASAVDRVGLDPDELLTTLDSLRG